MACWVLWYCGCNNRQMDNKIRKQLFLAQEKKGTRTQNMTNCSRWSHKICNSSSSTVSLYNLFRQIGETLKPSPCLICFVWLRGNFVAWIVFLPIQKISFVCWLLLPTVKYNNCTWKEVWRMYWNSILEWQGKNLNWWLKYKCNNIDWVNKICLVHFVKMSDQKEDLKGHMSSVLRKTYFQHWHQLSPP